MGEIFNICLLYIKEKYYLYKILRGVVDNEEYSDYSVSKRVEDKIYIKGN